ncbi:MAG: ParB/RepB/Spo0J family partition protein [Bacillota bacterium]
MGRKRLGRGLEALIPVQEAPASRQDVPASIALRLIDPNPYQPRREFPQDKLEELTESIRVHGVIQPVVVRAVGDRYQLVAGERRCRAAKAAGLTEVPALIKEYNDTQMLELAIVENLQRDDLNPLEEANAYQQLISRLGLTQDQAAERVGKSRSHVANTLRLLQLPPILQEYVSRETISAGHARALLSLSSAAQQTAAAEQVIRLGLNVRQTERLVRQALQETSVSRETRKSTAPPEIVDLERQLQSGLGTGVRIIRGRKRGRIEISFSSADELERLLEQLLSICSN